MVLLNLALLIVKTCLSIRQNRSGLFLRDWAMLLFFLMLLSFLLSLLVKVLAHRMIEFLAGELSAYVVQELRFTGVIDQI